MLNINSLYNAVFKPECQKFDPLNDYYTIILDAPEFAPLYSEFSSRLGYLMNPEAYTYMHCGEAEPLRRGDVEEQLSQIAEMLDIRTNGMPPQRRFCLMLYFDDDHRDLSHLKQLISWTDAGPRDVLSLFVCLSKNMKETDKFLVELSQALAEWADTVDLYLFTETNTAFYRRNLLYSLCGAILMNSRIADYQKRKARKASAVTSVEQYVDSMAEDGRKSIEAMVPIRWSSLYCRYYDRQYDFLNQYIATACDNIKELTKEGFAEELDSIYKQTMPYRDTRAIKATLQKAIAYIPYVVPASPKLAMSTLRYYFDHVYGEQGTQTVEMTIKATLAGLFDFRMEDLSQQCSELIFERCAAYAMDDLYERVQELLDHYVGVLQKSCTSFAKTVQLSLDDDMPEEARESHLDDYLGRYVELYTRQKACAFWENVARLIRTYPDRFREACARARENYRLLGALKDSLPTNFVYRFDIVDDRKYAAGQLLELEKDEEGCARIREKFECVKSDGTGIVAPSDCNLVFAIPIAPHFYKGENVRMDTTSYSLSGFEINGKYLVTMGAE